MREKIILSILFNVGKRPWGYIVSCSLDTVILFALDNTVVVFLYTVFFPLDTVVFFCFPAYIGGVFWFPGYCGGFEVEILYLGRSFGEYCGSL